MEKVGYPGNEKEFDQWELVPGATGYRLLREAEWEVACRAGSTSDWSSGSDEQLLVDYCQMSPSEFPAEVGRKLPNAWGLHDMHGNVLEWCDSQKMRGGSWDQIAAFCLSEVPFRVEVSSRANINGFRVALSSSSGVFSPAEQGR